MRLVTRIALRAARFPGLASSCDRAGGAAACGVFERVGQLALGGAR